MTNTEKGKALRNAAAESLSSVFAMYNWKKVKDKEGVYILSGVI